MINKYNLKCSIFIAVVIIFLPISSYSDVNISRLPQDHVTEERWREEANKILTKYANGKNFITYEQFLSYLYTEEFNKLDTDENGRLLFDEYMTALLFCKKQGGNYVCKNTDNEYKFSKSWNQ